MEIALLNTYLADWEYNKFIVLPAIIRISQIFARHSITWTLCRYKYITLHDTLNAVPTATEFSDGGLYYLSPCRSQLDGTNMEYYPKHPQPFSFSEALKFDVATITEGSFLALDCTHARTNNRIFLITHPYLSRNHASAELLTTPQANAR